MMKIVTPRVALPFTVVHTYGHFKLKYFHSTEFEFIATTATVKLDIHLIFGLDSLISIQSFLYTNLTCIYTSVFT